MAEQLKKQEVKREGQAINQPPHNHPEGKKTFKPVCETFLHLV